MSKTKLLDSITSLKILRELPDEMLPQLAEEIRRDMIEIVSVTGGHLGAGLGVVELTIAIHKVFNTPDDKLVWDVGHQTYPHKIITDRRKLMYTIRQKNGLSGFTNRNESIFDPFGAAHSSTSISAALGMQAAAKVRNLKHRIIAVIGDGAMSAGMAFEAMNNAGADKSIDNQIIVILNDNDMSIAPPVGAMSKYLARLFSSKGYVNLKNIAKQVVSKLPSEIGAKAEKVQEYGKTLLTGGTLFEELGFNYIGPIDGHSFQHLMPVLRNIKNNPQGPTIIHAITKKGKGYPPAERATDKLHGVSKFEINTGKQKTTTKKLPTYTKIFSQTLIDFAKTNPDIVAITSAMPSGTGLDEFAKHFPDRCYDVGIAEQHALTFAAGMAAQGIKPFVAIYSTFLQRAYDQVVHDIAIQSLPVKIAIDRAGLVGEDGPTHAGAFDITFLGTLPNFILMAPSDENELARMIATAIDINHAPCAFRYPRGSITGDIDIQKPIRKIEIGKGRIVKNGEDIAIINYGTRMKECLIAAKKLEKYNLHITIADARFAKPIDTELINQIVEKHSHIITIEEGAIGGFATQVFNDLIKNNKKQKLDKIIPMFLPDEFIYQASVGEMYRDAKLDSEAIINKICNLARIKR